MRKLNRKLDEEELKQQLYDKYLQEVEKLEKELENIPDSEKWEPSEGEFQKILAKAKERGLLESSGTSEKERITDNRFKTKEKLNIEKSYTKQGNKQQRFQNIKRGVIKWTAVAAVTVVGVFGVSMSSQANRAYVMEEINKMFGNDTATKINNDDVLEWEDEEGNARGEIEKALNIKVPKFYYLPQGMKFESYTVDETADMAIMNYSYKEQTFYFMIYASEKSAVGISQKDTDVEKKIFYSDLTANLNISMIEVFEDGDKKPTYILQWKYKNVYCEFLGKLPEEEMKKIAKEIMY